ncbi:MAG: aspartate ammonia-lyase [Acidobacteriota bacterium]|jgi:aspartate ammonia-lyase|nr:aspartate ammonia-lyase [Acidobacteriota bacterium]
MTSREAFRTEHDLLGEKEVPADALYGIHAVRAAENFPLAGRPPHPALIRAYGAVKLACARVNHELGRWDGTTFRAIEAACLEMAEGRLGGHILADALQGGAGTSTNMNVNEVLCNRALQLLGRPLGDYATLHPVEDINLHQSTNDTYPTALKVAAIQMLRDLQAEVVALLEEFQRKEQEFARVVKVGRTQLQDAVLTTLGREMGAYAEAFARDRWRIYKCEERLRLVNLGGTAIGTGLGAPKQFIFRAVERLREVTGLGIARAENLVECTQNADVFVEVSGILKACATNLLKTATDLRLLSSGPDAGLGELRLPARQAGSSIMPGKVNPVVPEAVSQAAMLVMAHDQAIAQACAAGNLELNPFLPLVAEALLGSLGLLAGACRILRENCVAGLEADEGRCRRHVEGATASLTALVEAIGYEKAEALADLARREGKSAREVVVASGVLGAEEYDRLTSAESVTKLGS